LKRENFCFEPAKSGISELSLDETAFITPSRVERCDMLKRFMLVLMMLVAAGSFVFAGGRQEKTPEPSVQAPEPAVPQSEPEPVQEPESETPQPRPSGEGITVEMAVFKGPSGFAYVQLIEHGVNFVDGISISTQVLPSPAEAVAKLSSGELDVAALPVNLAATLYNKGVDIRLAAVTGEGLLYLMSTQSGRISDFAGKTINIPGAGSSPDYVSQYVFAQSGVDDVQFDYSISSPAQLAQMMIAGKVEHAVLPEPFASMAASKSSEVKRAVDMQKSWSALSGQGNYPMTALVMREDFIASHPTAARVISMGVADSIDWVNENPKEAALLIEKHEILTAALAEPAIPKCNLVYTPADQARSGIEAFYKLLSSFDRASIGGALPDEAFYLEK
jgi:NitT/TauT family transport system substrate-binding protein